MNYIKAIFTALKATSAKIDWEYFKKVEDWNENVGSALTPVSDISRLTEVSGDGLTTASLHDKSGNATWVNYGLTAVDGFRGKAISANGSSYAIADSPVIGTTGTIAIKIKTGSDVTTSQWIVSTVTASFYGGIGILIELGNLKVYQNDGVSSDDRNIVGVVANTEYSIILRFNNTTSILLSINNVSYDYISAIPFPPSSSNMQLARFTGGLSYLKGTIDIFRCDSRVWTDAEVLSWHNDPRSVDSVRSELSMPMPKHYSSWAVGECRYVVGSDNGAINTPSIANSKWLIMSHFAVVVATGIPKMSLTEQDLIFAGSMQIDSASGSGVKNVAYIMRIS